MGSVPPVALKRACTSAGEMVQALEDTWQELQVRPFVPRFWKNALLTSIRPLALYVPRTPLASSVNSGLGTRFWANSPAPKSGTTIASKIGGLVRISLSGLVMEHLRDSSVIRFGGGGMARHECVPPHGRQTF